MAHASTCLQFITQIIFMGGCIEMKGIHHILHTLDRALCHDINILVPMQTAHQDDIIQIILSDFRDDGFSVYLQSVHPSGLPAPHTVPGLHAAEPHVP